MYAFSRGNIVSPMMRCEVTDFESTYFAPENLDRTKENIARIGPFADRESSLKISSSHLITNLISALKAKSLGVLAFAEEMKNASFYPFEPVT